MQREMISMQEAVSMIGLFAFGNSAVMGVSSSAGNDSWIALITAFIFGSVLVLMYARVISLFPEMNVYDIAQIVFGKIFGKVIIFLMTWYAVHLGALILRDFSEFVQIVALEETPQLVVMLAILAITGYMVLSGIEILGKWSLIAGILIVMVVLVTVILSLKQADFSNLLPIMTHDISAMGSATLKLFTFPFAETVLFLTLADSIKRSDNPYKIYLGGIFIGAVVLLLVVLRNIVVLGFPMMEKSYFPSYTTARIINIAELFSRIEMAVFYNFILGVIVKLSICLFAAQKGMKMLFHTKKSGRTIFLISVMILLIGKFQFKNAMEMMNFMDVYQYYALPFQIVIPVLVWIGAEIKARKMKYVMNE